MTQPWTDLEDDDLWVLQPDELALVPGSSNDKGRLGFVLQLKFRQANGRYPERLDEFNPNIVKVMAKQLGVDATTLSNYGLDSRQGQRHRQIIRRFLGFQLPTGADLARLREWLTSDILPFDPQARHGFDAAQDWFLAQRLDMPALGELDRAIRSAVHCFEIHHQDAIHARLSGPCTAAIDRLLAGDDTDVGDSDNESARRSPAVSIFSQLKTDLGRASRDNLLIGIAKRQSIDVVGLSADVFDGVPAKFIDQFRQRCATESVRELRRHPAPIRYSMVAMFCWRRRQQLTDALVDMLLQLIHNIGTRAEKRIDKKQFAAFKKVRGKAKLLFKLARLPQLNPDFANFSPRWLCKWLIW